MPAPLAVDHAERPDALLRFEFAAGASGPLRIDCALLSGGQGLESWGRGARDAGAADEVLRRECGSYALVAVEEAEAADGLEAAAARAYRRLLAAVRPSTHPCLLRIWNYFAAINQGAGDEERYRRFCVGRAGAVDERFNDPPPAATAIGTDGEPGRLQLIALCSRAPAIALENPRQTPAWRYPREYGPVPPGFSRGIVIDGDAPVARLLASGTASIVGHASRHVGDCAAQLEESLRNLEHLLGEGGKRSGHAFALENCEALRVYLRHADDVVLAEPIIAATGIDRERMLFLRGDVCRHELDVELEGVFVGRR